MIKKIYVIEVEKIYLMASDGEEAEDRAIDIVNDIGHDGSYSIKEIEEKNIPIDKLKELKEDYAEDEE